MKAGYSLWIKDNNNKKVFGEGPYELLVLVNELGSLNKAAQAMQMSYSKTIKIIKKCENALNIKLLEREIGGLDGGGSTITKAGLDLIERYQKFKKNGEKAIKKAYNEAFYGFK